MSTSRNMHEVSTLEVFGMQAHSIIDELETIFPPVNPTPSESTASIMYKAGQRSVVEWLFNRMNNNG
jgi:hypothetical protein